MGNNTKTSIPFKAEWLDILNELPPAIRLAVYGAIVEYHLSGHITDLKGEARIAFLFIKAEIDAKNKRRQARIKRQQSATATASTSTSPSPNTTSSDPDSKDAFRDPSLLPPISELPPLPLKVPPMQIGGNPETGRIVINRPPLTPEERQRLLDPLIAATSLL